MSKRLSGLGLGLIVAVGLVCVWAIANHFRLLSPVFLPSPFLVMEALWSGFRDGSLLVQSGSTLTRMLSGWLLASFTGAILGLLIGGSPLVRPYLQPTLEFLRPLPASAVVPVAIAFMGLSEGMVLLVIVFGSLWPVLLSTIHGVSSIEPRLYEVSRILGMSKLEYIRKILLPSAVPDILAGAKFGLGVALILTIVGEMLASRHGLGYGAVMASRSFRSSELYACIFLIGVMGYLTTAILSKFERRILFYRSEVIQ